MSTQHPRLVTFAYDVESAQRHLAAGAEHLIIDDPRISIRSWAPPRQGDFSHLHDIAQAARSTKADVRLSLNVDGLYRDEQLPLIRQAIEAASFAGFDAIRLMDAGLGPMVRRISGDLHLELATEMGNCSIPCVEAYLREGFTHQVCSNDWPADDLTLLRQEHPELGMEILVHGPVLLQYSDRRQLSAQSHPDADPNELAATTWQTVVIDGRPYPFADHQHGNIMYNTFDRCLYPYGQKLWDIQLSSWLIDGRGQAPEYTASALAAFAQLRTQAQTKAPDLKDGAHWEALQAAGERRFKPGFFLANNTDHCFDDIVEEQQQVDVVAEVIDVIRKDAITLLVRQDFTQNDGDLTFTSPEGRSWQADLSQLSDYCGQRLTAARSGMIVRLPWVKGSIPATTLHKPSSSPY